MIAPERGFCRSRARYVRGASPAWSLQPYSEEGNGSMTSIKTRDSVHLFTKDWGSGRPVVLIHGWPLSSDTWDDVGIALAENGFRAIAYDRRGFGRSDQPYKGYDYDTLSADLADVLEATGARDAALVGFSMGGGEVARYMSRYEGKHVVQAALISSIVPYMTKTPDNPEGVDPAVFEEMTARLKEDRAKFFSSFFDDFFGRTALAKPVSAEVKQWAWSLAMKASLKATLDAAESFATTDFRSELSAFRVPTLVIHGTDDKTVPIDATSRVVAKSVQNARIEEYLGAPHGLFASHKQRLIADLLSFLLKV